MASFIHRENVLLFRRLLAEPNVTKDQVRHELLMRLLKEELAKAEKPVD